MRSAVTWGVTVKHSWLLQPWPCAVVTAALGACKHNTLLYNICTMLDQRRRRWANMCCVVRSHRGVTAHFSSEQILPFGLAWRLRCDPQCGVAGYCPHVISHRPCPITHCPSGIETAPEKNAHPGLDRRCAGAGPPLDRRCHRGHRLDRALIVLFIICQKIARRGNSSFNSLADG